VRGGRTVAERRGDADAELSAFEDLPAEPICVRVATAVRLTGIPRSTLYELIGSGQIEIAKVGRSTFVLYASLKRLFDKRRT
jgi:excisionase family DNA binding protein